MRAIATAQHKKSQLISWLDWLEQLQVKPSNPSLERAMRVACRLGLDKLDCPLITVAGSNGKGSCVAVMEAILLEADYHVASYTSPHLITYNERVRLNGDYVQDEMLCDAFAYIDSFRDGIELNYYEFSVLAALWCIKQASYDVILLEVGLGGRFDAVNILDADIVVITNISLEHTAILGDNREQIGFEKAGICRRAKTLIYGEQDIPDSIMQRAAELDMICYRQGVDFAYNEHGQHWDWSMGDCVYQDLGIKSILPQNAATALAALHALGSEIRVTEQQIKNGLNSLKLSGRYQHVVHKGRRYILDVAHNTAGAEVLAKRICASESWHKLYIIVGILDDKNSQAILQPFAKIADEWFICDIDQPRAKAAKVIIKELDSFCEAPKACFNSVSDAHRAVRALMTDADLLLVFGSFYTVADLIRNLR